MSDVEPRYDIFLSGRFSGERRSVPRKMLLKRKILHGLGKIERFYTKKEG